MFDLRKITNRAMRDKIMSALSFLPDKPYLQLFYFACEGKFINFRNPTTFCDKMNWLKIYDRHPEYNKLADKLAVRDYIKEAFGEKYLFPIYGYWRSFDQIDFDKLPEQFVLKCNHDSGSVRIIKNKNELTGSKIEQLRKFYNTKLKKDFFYVGREFPYKGIERYVFAEKYMKGSNNDLEAFEDYKFMCFNGVPKIMYIESERDVGVKMDAYDMDFCPVDIEGDKPKSGKVIEKPSYFDEMKAMAEKLAKGIKFVRIDFRVLDNQVYFGEFTFYDNGGFRSFQPKEWDLKLASWIEV